MEYKFIITALEKTDKDNLKDVVTTIHWRYQDVNDCTFSTFGAYTFEKIITVGFIDYSNLDENIVISWLYDALDIKDLQSKIESQKVNAVPGIVHFPFAQTIEVPKFEIPTIEVPVFEKPTIELPVFEKPTIEIPTIELPKP